MNEVIFIIHAEESWKCVMLEPSSIDGSAMVAAKWNKFNPTVVGEVGRYDGSKNLNHEELWCTFCKKPLRTKEKY